MVEKAGTTTFIHPQGKELDAKITRQYEKGAIAVTNFAAVDNQEFMGKVGEKIQDTLIKAWKDRDELEEDWELYRALYDMVNLDTSIRSNANVHVPEVRKAVDVRVRELMIAIFSRDQWARAIGLNRDSAKKSRKITDFQLDQMRTEKFTVKFKQWIKNLVMFGTSAALTNWDSLPRRLNFATIKIEDGEDGTRKVTIERPSDKDRNLQVGQPVFQPLRLLDFVGDPDFFDIQKGTFAGHRVLMTKAQVNAMANAGLYANVEKIQPTNRVAHHSRRDVVARFRTDDLRATATASGTDEFEIWEVWSPFMLPDTGEMRESVITVDRVSMTVLRISENPFWHGLRPYLVAQYTQDVDAGLYGTGIIDPIASLQMELDDTRNLSLIAKDLIINPMWEAPYETDLAGERLVALPGKIMPPGLRPVQMANNLFTAFQHEAVIKADIREVISTPAALAGGPQAGAETATENVNRIQEAKSDTAELARDISDLVLIPMLIMRHALNVQFLREERVFRKLGAQARPGAPLFEVIDPSDLIGDYLFEWQGLRDFAVKGKRVGLMRQMLDALVRFPQLQQPGAINVGEVARDMVRELFDDETAQKYFPDLREEEILSPTEEHELIMLGGPLDVHPMDNHLQHAQAHKVFMQNSPRGLDMVKQGHLEAHFRNHMLEAQRELARIARQAQAQQVMAAAQGAQPGGPQPGQPGVQRQRGSRPREAVINPAATQAPEAQEAQISGVGVQ